MRNIPFQMFILTLLGLSNLTHGGTEAAKPSAPYWESFPIDSSFVCMGEMIAGLSYNQDKEAWQELSTKTHKWVITKVPIDTHMCGIFGRDNRDIITKNSAHASLSRCYSISQIGYESEYGPLDTIRDSTGICAEEYKNKKLVEVSCDPFRYQVRFIPNGSFIIKNTPLDFRLRPDTNDSEVLHQYIETGHCTQIK